MKPLYITAHYDDLEICAGGTAKRYGGTSVVLYAKQTAGTKAEAEAAAEILGVAMAEPEHYKGHRALIAQLDLLAEYHDVIVATSPWDSHHEHQAAADIARELARKGTPLWFMDHAIPGGYGRGPRPSHFVNIGIEFDKYDALDCYSVLTQKHIKTVMYRDRYYGGIHNVPAAEGFVVQDTIT